MMTKYTNYTYKDNADNAPRETLWQYYIVERVGSDKPFQTCGGGGGGFYKTFSQAKSAIRKAMGIPKGQRVYWWAA